MVSVRQASKPSYHKDVHAACRQAREMPPRDESNVGQVLVWLVIILLLVIWYLYRQTAQLSDSLALAQKGEALSNR